VIEKKYLLHDIKIGANSTVVKDIEEPGIYVGVPTKKIK
jgi:serine acetyltransferase